MEAVLSTVFCGQRTLLQLIAAWSVIRVRICARNGGSAHKAPAVAHGPYAFSLQQRCRFATFPFAGPLSEEIDAMQVVHDVGGAKVV